MNKHITIKHNQPTMTVEETIELLNKAGYKAAICDTWVKEYDVKLRCGIAWGSVQRELRLDKSAEEFR